MKNEYINPVKLIRNNDIRKGCLTLARIFTLCQEATVPSF